MALKALDVTYNIPTVTMGDISVALDNGPDYKVKTSYVWFRNFFTFLNTVCWLMYDSMNYKDYITPYC